MENFVPTTSANPKPEKPLSSSPLGWAGLGTLAGLAGGIVYIATIDRLYGATNLGLAFLGVMAIGFIYIPIGATILGFLTALILKRSSLLKPILWAINGLIVVSGFALGLLAAQSFKNDDVAQAKRNLEYEQQQQQRATNARTTSSISQCQTYAQNQELWLACTDNSFATNADLGPCLTQALLASQSDVQMVETGYCGFYLSRLTKSIAVCNQLSGSFAINYCQSLYIADLGLRPEVLSGIPQGSQAIYRLCLGRGLAAADRQMCLQNVLSDPDWTDHSAQTTAFLCAYVGPRASMTADHQASYDRYCSKAS